MPISPKVSEIDSMFNLLLSEKQEQRNQFAKEYLQRKIDRRIKEIEELSTVKKRHNWIDEAKIVLDEKVRDSHSKNEKNYYQIHFSQTPDPAYLRAKADVMTDAEVLKHRMRKDNLTSRYKSTDCENTEAIRPPTIRNKKKTLSSQQDLGARNEKFHSTLDLRDTPIIRSPRELYDRLNTYEDKYDDLNDREDFTPTFISTINPDKKGKVVMSLGNLVTRLENLVTDLNKQINYVNSESCTSEAVDKIQQYQQLIESQLVGTINLSSFKYLQDSINLLIHRPMELSQSWSNNTLESVRMRNSTFTSPEPSKHLDMCLSQPTYRRSNNNENEGPSSQREKPKVEIDSMLKKYEGMAKPNSEVTKSQVKKAPKVTENAKKQPVNNKKTNCKKKNKKSTELSKKILDMRQTTAEIVNRRKDRRSATNYKYVVMLVYYDLVSTIIVLKIRNLQCLTFLLGLRLLL